jgi:hypothetical protein
MGKTANTEKLKCKPTGILIHFLLELFKVPGEQLKTRHLTWFYQVVRFISKCEYYFSNFLSEDLGKGIWVWNNSGVAYLILLQLLMILVLKIIIFHIKS